MGLRGYFLSIIMKKTVGLVWSTLLWALMVVASQGYALEGSWQLINNRDIKLDPSIDIEFQFIRSIGPNQTIVRSLVVRACYELNYTYQVVQNSLSMNFQGILGIPRKCMGGEISTIRSKIDTVFYFVINGTTLSLFDPTGFAPFVFTNNDAAVGAAINGGWQTLTVNQEGQYQNIYLNGSHAFLCNGSGMAVYNVTSRSQIIFTIIRSLGCTRDQIAVLSALDSTIFYRVLNGNYLYLYDYRLNNILYAYYTSFVGYQQDLKVFINNLNAPPQSNDSKTGLNNTSGNGTAATPNQNKSNADQNGQQGQASGKSVTQNKNSNANTPSPSIPSQTSSPALQPENPQKATTLNPTTQEKNGQASPPSATKPPQTPAPPVTLLTPLPSTPTYVPLSTPTSSTPVSVPPSPLAPNVPKYSAPAVSNGPAVINDSVLPPTPSSSIPASPPTPPTPSSSIPASPPTPPTPVSASKNVPTVSSNTNASGTTNSTQSSSNSTANSSSSNTPNSSNSSNSTSNSSSSSNSTSNSTSLPSQPVATTATTPVSSSPSSPAPPKGLSSVAELVSVSSRLLDGKWYVSSIGSQGGASFKGYYFIVNSSARRFIMYGGCNVQFYIYTLNNAQISFGTPTGTKKICMPNNDPSVTEPIFTNAVYLQATEKSLIFYDSQLGVSAVLVNSSPS